MCILYRKESSIVLPLGKKASILVRMSMCSYFPFSFWRRECNEREHFKWTVRSSHTHSLFDERKRHWYFFPPLNVRRRATRSSLCVFEFHSNIHSYILILTQLNAFYGKHFNASAVFPFSLNRVPRFGCAYDCVWVCFVVVFFFVEQLPATERTHYVWYIIRKYP